MLLEENRSNGKTVKNIFAVMDGGRLTCVDFTDVDVQNRYYEGYTGNEEVTNLSV